MEFALPVSSERVESGGAIRQLNPRTGDESGKRLRDRIGWVILKRLQNEDALRNHGRQQHENDLAAVARLEESPSGFGVR
jgi:hypothetical protein